LAASAYASEYAPLDQGTFDIQFQAGISPIIWGHRGSFYTINCEGFEIPIVQIFNTPPFHTFFRTPWIAGCQLGYADNTRLYLEFNYLKAKTKNPTILTTNPLVTPVQAAAFNIKNYHVYDLFAGLRYYSQRLCNRASIFVGGQLGVSYHHAVSFNSLVISVPDITITVIYSTPTTHLFKHAALISGGCNIGVDVNLCNNWSLVITAEVIANCGPRSNANMILSPVTIQMSLPDLITATNLTMNQIQTEMRFPITAGLRYSF
jgi:hypothetical protein